MPQNGRDRANWLQRREEVVDRAAALFAANGYHGTGVAALGDSVGLARGALYYYIESKATLLTLIHERVLAEVLAAGNAAQEIHSSAGERLRFLGRELVRINTKFPDHVWVFLHEFRNLQGDAAITIRRQRWAFEERVEQILIDGCRSGEFEIADTRLAALGWLGLHNSIYIWHRPDGPFTAEDISGQFGEVFLNGIRPRSTAP